MKKITFQLMGLGLFFLLPFIACQELEPIDGVDYRPEFAVPLINTHVTIQDALDASSGDLSFLEVGADGSMTVSYDQKMSIPLDMSIMEVMPDVEIPIMDAQSKIAMDFAEEVQFTKAHIKGGTVSFAAASNRQENVTVTLTMPDITKEGLPLELTARMFYQGSSPMSVESTSFSLTGYEMVVDNDEIEVNYTAVNDAGAVVMLDGMVLRVADWKFSYVQGVWGDFTYGRNKDTLAFESFTDFFEGELNLTDPQLSITVDNSVGFPITAHVDLLRVITAENNPLDLQSDAIADGIAIDYPKMNQVGASMETQLVLNRDNSNLDDILNSDPSELIYQIGIVTNPPTGTSYEGFITENSKVDLTLHTEIPLHGTISGLTFVDTLESDLQDLEGFNKAEFKLITENEIPMEGQLQVYFVNAFGQVIDSLFDSHATLLSAAPVDATGEVSGMSLQETFVLISGSRLETLQASKNAILDARFETYNNGQTPVMINAQQGLRIKIGLRAEVNP